MGKHSHPSESKPMGIGTRLALIAAGSVAVGLGLYAVILIAGTFTGM